MSLQTPTTKEINENIIAQLEASLNQTIPLLPKSFLRVLSKALAGVFILLYKYAGFMFLQQFVRTASIEPTEINGETVRPLIEWGRLVGVGDPVPATQAELLIDITVNNQGGTLPSNSQLIGADNGVTYITIGSVALDASTVQATIRAVSDQSGGGGSGVVGNLDPGAIVSFANPLADIERRATVNSQVVTGANAEATDVYRQRVVDRFQKRPQGGAYADYEQWGEEVAGILNVYPYTSECPGQVDLYVEATVASSGSPDGIPTNAQLQAVLDSVELDDAGLASRRPANALANAFPITRVPFDVRVTGLLVDDLAQVRDDIEDALTEYFLSREPFIPGLSIPPRRDRITQSAVAGAVEDIVTAANGIFSGATISTNSIELTVYSLGAGEKAKLNSVVYV
jgi:uncharacterized phage protein gp47/JayE